MLGRTIAGKYRIEAHLGSGSMGEVWRAKHLALDSSIALKIMQADLAKDEAYKERFYREARAASRLSHANSVRVLDYGVEADGLIYIAMELLAGRDLYAVVKAEFPLSDARVVHIMSQTLSALAVAHGLGIVHRDLKPENIMIASEADEDGHLRDEVKVCDFGIAKLSDPATFKTQNQGRALTKTGTLMGTPEYMSPEQARGESLDARSDLYSMGIVLYQMLAGKLPFTGDTILTVVLKQVTDAPVPPSEVRAGVNLALEAVCLRALRKEKSERYQTAKEMRADIRAAVRMPDSSGSLGRYDPPSSPNLVPMDVGSAPTVVVSPPQLPDAPVGRSRTVEGTAASAVGTAPAKTPKWIYGVVAIPALLIGGVGFALFTRPTAGGVRNLADPSAFASSSAAPFDSVTTTPTTPNRYRVDRDSNHAPTSLASAKGKPAPSTTASALAPLPSATTSSAAASTASAAGSSASTSTAAPTSYNPSSAFVALGTLTTSGVSRDPIAKKMSAALAQLSECYRDSLVAIGSPQGGSAEIHMSIDDAGKVVTIILAPKNPAFQRCGARPFGGFSVAKSDLQGGPADATQWLELKP